MKKTLGRAIKTLLVFLCVFVGLTTVSNAKPVIIEGRVLSVIDGDTMKIKLHDREIVVVLAGIDAPEKEQAYGLKARDFLKRLVRNRQVTGELTGKDKSGRYAGALWLGKKSINLEMVKAGYAWADRKNVRSPTLLNAEKKARKEKSGLWLSRSAVPPWQWRKEPKKK